MSNFNTESLLADRELMIFDLDGTLADTSAFHASAFADVLAPFGVAAEYETISGWKTRDALVERLASSGIVLAEGELDALARAKQQRVRKLIQDGLQPLPGVERFLRWASTRARLAIYSSGSRGTVEISLARLGYLGRFDPLLCAEDVVRAKPDPEGFLKVLGLTGVPSNHAVVFEDSDSGIGAARRAGLAVVDVRLISFEYLVQAFE